MITTEIRANKKRRGCILCGRPPVVAVDYYEGFLRFCDGCRWAAVAACRMPGAQFVNLRSNRPAETPPAKAPTEATPF